MTVCPPGIAIGTGSGLILCYSGWDCFRMHMHCDAIPFGRGAFPVAVRTASSILRYFLSLLLDICLTSIEFDRDIPFFFFPSFFRSSQA